MNLKSNQSVELQTFINFIIRHINEAMTPISFLKYMFLTVTKDFSFALFVKLIDRRDDEKYYNTQTIDDLKHYKPFYQNHAFTLLSYLQMGTIISFKGNYSAS